MDKSKTKQQLLLEVEDLRKRLEEAEETLRAIRSGEVDALVVSGPQGDRLYTLEGADQSYRILFETMEEGAATLGANGTVLYCNRRLAEMLGSPLEKVIGSSMEEYLSPDDWQSFKNIDKRGTAQRREFDLKRGDGSLISALISFGCLEIGVLQGTCMTVTDLTLQKRAEKELRKAHDELEKRVQERTEDLVESNKALEFEITKRKQAEEELQQMNETLEVQVQERTEELTASHQRLQQLSSQLIQAQEKERKRIAAELHDGLLSDLAAIKFLFEGRLMLLKKGRLADTNEFDKITDILQKVMKDARGIMNNLRPSILDEMGLIPTIGWLTQEYQKTYGHIQVLKQVEAVEKDIPDVLMVVMFRVLQEALNNFARHGRGTLVELSLLKSGDTLQLRIQDNGQGFDVERVQKGLGLESMRERVELSGGEFQIESVIGQGTTIRAIWRL